MVSGNVLSKRTPPMESCQVLPTSLSGSREPLLPCPFSGCPIFFFLRFFTNENFAIEKGSIKMLAYPSLHIVTDCRYRPTRATKNGEQPRLLH